MKNTGELMRIMGLVLILVLALGASPIIEVAAQGAHDGGPAGTLPKVGSVPAGGQGPTGVTGQEVPPLKRFGRYVGNVGVSADGLGISLTDTGFIQAEILEPDSEIIRAGLYVKTVPGWRLDQIGFGGSIVRVKEIPIGDPNPTLRAEVTSIVASAVGTGSGIFDFEVDESEAITGIGTLNIDGTALYVIYSNPALPDREIYLMHGGLPNPDPDPLDLRLASPYAGGPAEMGVAISFSAGNQEPPGHDCPPPGSQVTVITIEGSELSPCAGNKDDGDANANGALMTVGGIGDDLANPGVDDERYDLTPFLTAGDEVINMSFDNDSGDDFLFAFYVQIELPAE